MFYSWREYNGIQWFKYSDWWDACRTEPIQILLDTEILVFGQIFSVVRVPNVLYITEYSVYAEHSVFGRILWYLSDQNIRVQTETQNPVSVNHGLGTSHRAFHGPI